MPSTRPALPVDAYTGHAGAVAAFLSDSEATWSGHEMAEFVPERAWVEIRAHFRFLGGLDGQLFKRECARRLARSGRGAGALLRRVREWMRHADIQTTMCYPHYAPEPTLQRRWWSVQRGSGGVRPKGRRGAADQPLRRHHNH